MNALMRRCRFCNQFVLGTDKALYKVALYLDTYCRLDDEAVLGSTAGGHKISHNEVKKMKSLSLHTWGYMYILKECSLLYASEKISAAESWGIVLYCIFVYVQTWVTN